MITATPVDQNLNKEEKYKSLLPHIKSLVEGENNLIANLANVSALLNTTFEFSWVGFYLFDGSELILGPFQGPVACTRIKIGRGVCGKAFQKKKTILVKDVNQFEDHIACSAETQSEIVIPILVNHQAVGVLDVDSNQLNNFDLEDRNGLEAIAHLISHLF